MRLLLALLSLLIVGNCTLDPLTIPKFKTAITNALPVYKPKITSTVAGARGCRVSSGPSTSDCRLKYLVTTRKTSQQILPKGFPKTTLYTYGGDSTDSISGNNLGEVFSWPGPAFIIPRHTKVEITWRNGINGKHMFTIEKNLDFMHKSLNLDDFVPNIAHIHGMANPSNVDGIPEAWFTYDGRHGADYYSSGSALLRNQSVVSITTSQE